MAYGDAIAFSKEDTVGIITLNKPESFNLVSDKFLYELDEVQNDIEKDESIRALLIHANGDHFSRRYRFQYATEFQC